MREEETRWTQEKEIKLDEDEEEGGRDWNCLSEEREQT